MVPSLDTMAAFIAMTCLRHPGQHASLTLTALVVLGPRVDLVVIVSCFFLFIEIEALIDVVFIDVGVPSVGQDARVTAHDTQVAQSGC